jgi:FkbM family methyltransferase
MNTIIRIIYKYYIAFVHSTKLFFRSFMILSLRDWIRFWLPGPYTGKDISFGPLHYVFRSKHLSDRIVDLYMITTCVKDKQYNPPTFEIHPNDTVIDIGGHIGSFSLYAAYKASTGRVFVYEPAPENFAYLQKNIQLNHASHITAEKSAVAAEKGTRTFFSNNLNSAESSMHTTSNHGQQITVPSITLTDIFEEHNISTCNFLKLDCEGAEYEILFTTPRSYLRRINKIAMECHNPSYFNISDPRYTQETMQTFLRNNGFIVKEIKENAMHSLLFAWHDTSSN